MPFKNLSTTEATKEALHSWAQRIASAKSIVVAGAGATGIEIAGELGQEYAVTGKKQITLISDQDLPLTSKFRRDVRETAKKELERLKVKVITNAKVTSPTTTTTTTATPTPNTTITLTQTTPSPKSPSPPTTLQADLIIPTYGLTPNTSFLPTSLLDARGYVRQTTRLRAEGHDNIFVVGDAGNLQDPQGVHADAQTVHVVRLLEARVLGGRGRGGGVEKEEEYTPVGKITFAATLGRNRGTGQVGNWRVWSLLVWFLKGRYLGTNVAAEFVRGEKTLGGKAW